MENLENAWIRDIVDADSYQRMCQRLISQKRELYDGDFKSKVWALMHSLPQHFSMGDFCCVDLVPGVCRLGR